MYIHLLYIQLNSETMKKTLYTADSRGYANHGWLKSHHTFSFANYYNPERIHFGALRVINDDSVAGGQGFGAHPHDNMEIISIPLSGSLAHKDSTGNEEVIQTNDVQIMSAGTGLRHSEYNGSKTEAVNFLQIWVFPKERNIQPRYEQKTFDPAQRVNQWQTVVSPDKDSGGVWINQDAFFSLATLENGKSLSYSRKLEGNGLYLFVLEGEVKAAQEVLKRRDAVGLSELAELTIEATADAQLLLMEVPMELPS